MQFTTSLLALSLSAGTLAKPISARQYEVTLTFHGGPASYSLTVPTDGSIVETDNDLSISIIDSPGFDAYEYCTFYTSGKQTLVSSDYEQQITVGPPQPIISVSCEA
ncbi:hypothetical protein GGR56DRAFT_673956 [Xylariaceae sp. FL0804]|nr:hypothetical protein GGR56DRAFT_673956 [Xylariaceae sp. FL0804]